MQTVKYYYVPQYSMFMVLHVKRIIILAEIISVVVMETHFKPKTVLAEN